LNSGLCVCKAGAQLFESILLCLFWRWGLANYLPGWASSSDRLISASQVARITSMSQSLVPGLLQLIFE
jgi:hypothetical protein